MKNLVVLYGAELSLHAFEKSFGSQNAFQRVLDWAALFGEKIVLFVNDSSPVFSQISATVSQNPKVDFITHEVWSKSLFISEISSVLKKYGAANAIVSYADTPFLNKKLTEELLDMHTKYSAEYSFADGFPYGLVPEVIEAGTAAILSELSKDTLKSEGEKPLDREAIFSVMKGDINSFEIETLISDVDYRLLRFNFESSTKINALSCKNLFDAARRQKIDLEDPYALSDLASKTASVCQTIPAFYNIQISSKYAHKCSYSLSSIGMNPCPKEFMPLSDIKKILARIRDFSENAVISLSAFGEPLLHPDFLEAALEVINQNDENHKISLLIETDGLLVTEEISQKISAQASSKNAEVNWIVFIDSVEKSMYANIHGCGDSDFEKALASVPLLEKSFPHHVYPQFMRMKTNEAQLEAFYRFWKEKSSPSQGELIIQKYNSFCGILPDLKSADLSPVNRLPCWHLRRDMTILSDGTVPLCFQHPETPLGNLLSGDIGKAWSSIMEMLARHINKNYTAECEACDESYTFNF